MDRLKNSSLVVAGVTVTYFLLVTIDVVVFTTTTTPDEIEAANTYVASEGLPQPPRQFFHDGCTAAPDHLLWHDFTDACFAHDLAYWAGGSVEQKRAADQTFREEISDTGPLGTMFAPVLYYGVRFFGDSLVTRLLDANWGYGWNGVDR